MVIRIISVLHYPFNSSSSPTSLFYAPPAITSHLGFFCIFAQNDIRWPFTSSLYITVSAALWACFSTSLVFPQCRSQRCYTSIHSSHVYIVPHPLLLFKYTKLVNWLSPTLALIVGNDRMLYSAVGRRMFGLITSKPDTMQCGSTCTSTFIHLDHFLLSLSVLLSRLSFSGCISDKKVKDYHVRCLFSEWHGCLNQTSPTISSDNSCQGVRCVFFLQACNSSKMFWKRAIHLPNQKYKYFHLTCSAIYPSTMIDGVSFGDLAGGMSVFSRLEWKKMPLWLWQKKNPNKWTNNHLKVCMWALMVSSSVEL